ncbi:MAG: hypothetical protein D6775_10250 [Caldilineae bacterium]|nr:MAG: hypothetical protein D6775_10250 [Caldilineae bacterium]
MKTLILHGTPYEMGYQHGVGVRALRGQVLAAVAAREQELERLPYDVSPVLAEAVEALASAGQATWDMLHGIAAGLGVPAARMQRYALSSYLLDYRYRLGLPGQDGTGGSEGCTCVAVSAPLLADGRALLAKNRDYRLEHQDLQVLGDSRPARGYRYIHLGSAGSAGVFSSGMNERGLAVADTHVVSRDIGPGLPRFALMQEILAHFDSVPAACAYLREVRHMGGGTLLLVDRAGRIGLCESAYRHPVIEMQPEGWVVRTNHFLSERLRDVWVETDPPGERGNSQARYDWVVRRLSTASSVDVGWVKALLASHRAGSAALCRHPRRGRSSATISGIIFLPAQGSLWLAAGRPCEAGWEMRAGTETGLQLHR